MASKLRIYYGDDAFKPEKPNVALIDRVLYQDDICLLQGGEKGGKSILAQQMSFCLTSGEPFLGKYKVLAPKNVVYFQAEGKSNETVERRLRMEKVVKCDRKRYAHFYKKFFPIDNDQYLEFIIKAIDSLPWKPDVLFFDALYMGMQGDLIDNKEVRKFEANFALIVEKYDLTAIILHHESKEPVDEDGVAIERGDKGTYGSVFIRSWVDTIYNLRKRGLKTRTLECETQRSGKVFRKEDLVLIGNAESDSLNEPLYFEIAEDVSATCSGVLAIVKAKTKITREEIKELLNISESTAYKAIRELIGQKKIKEIEKGVYVPYEQQSKSNENPAS